MNPLELGQIDDAVVLFGGAYSNLRALQALRARTRGPMICTGDVVAYCAEPAETVALIRALGCPVVAGNCERQLAARAADCGCGFDAGSVCDRLAMGWYPFADARVGDAERAWMTELPDIATFAHCGRRYAVIHGGLTAISRFVWSTSPDRVFAEEIAAIAAAIGPVDAVVAGHSGIPFQRRVGGVDWINAGAIGMPPNDGSPQTRFAVLEHGAFRFERLGYDHHAAAAAMRRAGLTQGYDRALLSGYWPSEDVLPEDLRKGVLARG